MNHALLLNILLSLSQDSLYMLCNIFVQCNEFELLFFEHYYNLNKDSIVKFVNDSSVIKSKPKSTIAPLSSTMIDYGGI